MSTVELVLKHSFPIQPDGAPLQNHQERTGDDLPAAKRALCRFAQDYYARRSDLSCLASRVRVLSPKMGGDFQEEVRGQDPSGRALFWFLKAGEWLNKASACRSHEVTQGGETQLSVTANLRPLEHFSLDPDPTLQIGGYPSYVALTPKTEGDWAALLSGHPNISKLVVDFDDNEVTANLGSLMDAFNRGRHRRLEEVTIYGSVADGDEATHCGVIPQFSRCLNLRAVELSGVGWLSTASGQTVWDELGRCSGLESLSLFGFEGHGCSGDSHIEEGKLNRIAHANHSLRTLCLKNQPLLGNLDVAAMPGLEVFEERGTNLNAETFIRIASACPGLHTLDFRTPVSGAEFVEIFRARHGRGMPGLRGLHYTCMEEGPEGVNDASICAAALYWDRLQDLSLEDNRKDKLSGGILPAIATHCRSLQSLEVVIKGGLLEGQVEELLKQCPRLTHLSIVACDSATASELSKQVEEAMPLLGNLRELEVSMSAGLLHRLRDVYPNLALTHLGSWGAIEDDGTQEGPCPMKEDEKEEAGAPQ